MAIPVLTIQDGKAVIVHKGKDPEPVEDEDGHPVDLVEFVQELVKRNGSTIYVNDLNGIENNSPQFTIIKKIAGEADLWVDAGSRSGEALIDVIFAGAARAVLSTKSMGDLEDIEEALEVSDGLMLCIDYDKGLIARNRKISKMSPAMVAAAAQEAGINDIVLADHGRKSKGELMLDIVSAMARSGMRVYVAGKVTGKDLPALRKAGAMGALMGLEDVVKDWQ